MKIHGIVFCLGIGFGLAACGGNDGEKFAKLADEVCACKDMECANKVEEKWKSLEKEMKGKYNKDNKPDESVIEAYKKAEDKAEACVEKLESAGGEAPPAEAPAE